MASTDRKIETTLRGATRKSTSSMGNPTWTVHTDDGDWTTQTDASLGYSIENYTIGPDSLVGRPVTLTTTKAGRVWNIEPRDES